ncbi:MAG: amidohydrolase [Oscillospiraceae bacterium]|nr:amidohydrolase [Oscillospiraceae bacterium]MDD4415036.1 amidohydrolase [Oscillospiraceae bacterium]
MVIINARIIPVDKTIIESGFVGIENGKISEVSAMPYSGSDADAFDAQGGIVLPGFVDAHTHLGMWEDAMGFEGDDGNEDTDPSTPHLRAVDAVNPLDRCFTEALASGVTTVVTGPGSSNPIGGQLCAMKTYGRRMEDMIIKAPVAMKMALGENPKTVYHGKNQAPVTRMATAAIIRQQLFHAKRYDEDKRRAEQDEEAEQPEYDAKYEALLPVIRGELPVHFHAHRLDDIFTAQRLAKEFNLNHVIIHGTQAHLAADLIAADNTRVLCGPLLCDRSKPELHGLTPKSPALLYNAGVKVAIITDHPVIPENYLALCAGLAVREGLPYEQALRAITLSPAEICQIDDRVGSITPGKDADLVLFKDDPLTVTAKPSAVFCGGMRVL